MNRLAVLQDVFRQVFDDEALMVSPTMRRDEMKDWDSVAHVKLILTLEEEFQIRFSEREISSIETVDDLLKAIEHHGRANA